MSAENPSLPPVFFNHLYVVLDDKTYRAIQSSDFLRVAFSGAERRSTLTAAGETWSGTYFYCRENYLELFGASAGRHWLPGAQEGWAGLAFSTDQSGGVAAVRQAIRAALNYDPYTELRQLRAGERSVNWFYYVNLAERLGLGSFDAWVMEYHPEIFTHKHLALPDPQHPARKDYLAAWNTDRWNEVPVTGDRSGAKKPAKEKDHPGAANLPAAPLEGSSSMAAGQPAADRPRPADLSPQAASGLSTSGFTGGGKPRPDPIGPPSPTTPVFSSITGATIHMDERRAARFVEVLGLLGYQLSEADGELRLSAHGFTLAIRPEDSAPLGPYAAGRYRLSSLRLAMARPSVAPMTFVFAPGSRLDLREDLVAEWRFGEQRQG